MYAALINDGTVILSLTTEYISHLPYISVPDDTVFDPLYRYSIDFENKVLVATKRPDPVPEPEPEPETDDVWAQLANAIKEGVNEV